MKLAKKRARCCVESAGELIRSYAFLKNKFGYLVMADAIVYNLDDELGKKWCVVLHPYLQSQAVLVTNTRGEVVGLTE